MPKPIVIIYCGSVFTKGLYDKLLQYHQTPVMVPHNFPADRIAALGAAGIIISGSGSYVNDPIAERVDQGIYNLGLPILGICYGMQRMAQDLGGEVKKMRNPERELQDMELNEVGKQSLLFQDFAEDGMPVWMAHNCKVTKLPPGFFCGGKTESTSIAMMADPERDFYGVQFHPEHQGRDPSSQAGSLVVYRFLKDVCGQEL
jgi:GMP synthase (glutamine-hydrolysing)